MTAEPSNSPADRPEAIDGDQEFSEPQLPAPHTPAARHLAILTHSMVFIAVILGGYVLVAGRDLFVPFAIALLIWFLINAFTAFLHRFEIAGRRLSRRLSLVVALVVIALAVGETISLIARNVGALSEAAPHYSDNARVIISALFTRLHLPEPQSLSEMAAQIDLGSWIAVVASGLSGFAEKLVLVFIYVMFLLVAQSAWRRKFGKLVPDRGRRARLVGLIHHVRAEVQAYLWIRTFLSVAAAITSYLVLIAVGLDFASFWALVIFLLNFIPTIGPVLGVVGPALLALLQFGPSASFAVVAIGLGVTQFLLDNVVSPRIQGARLGLDPVVLLLALVGWGMMWGLAGMFLSAPFTVIAMIVMGHFPATRPIAVLLSDDGDLK